MNKNKFTGWKDVFSFTLHQTVDSKAFKVSTICFAFILFLAVGIVNIVTAANSDKDKSSPITVVHVIDESGFTATDFNQLSQKGKTAYSDIKFVSATSDDTIEKLLSTLEANTTEVVLHIVKDDEGYGMRIAIPANSRITEGEGKALLNQVVPYFEMNKLTQIGLTEVQLASVNIPVTTSFSTAGEEEESKGEMIVKMFAPMLFSLVLYIMLLLYGQSICKTLLTEKTSKLMELLLTSSTPYALITGKVLAMTLLAIGQFILWISSALGGFIAGNYIAKVMYPDYQSELISVLKLIKENTNASAFSVSSIILAVVVLCFGFLFYSVLAGIIGAILNKAEDLSSGMSLYQIPVVISFFAAYLIPLDRGNAWVGFIRFFPFTSPFSVPADLVIGNMGVIQGCISLGILLIATLLLIILAGKIYKGLVLFNGNKITGKIMLQIVKTKL